MTYHTETVKICTTKGLFYLCRELLLAETVGRSQDPVHIWIGISLHYNTLTLIYEQSLQAITILMLLSEDGAYGMMSNSILIQHEYV
jgi:hypothetical protein